MANHDPRVVRVFVSSTFSDMQAERELMVKSGDAPPGTVAERSTPRPSDLDRRSHRAVTRRAITPAWHQVDVAVDSWRHSRYVSALHQSQQP